MHQPGDILITTIESLAFQGHGIAKPDGFTIFVPRTTPGDKVEIEITQNKKSFAFAKCKKVIVASQDRVQAPCVFFEHCGGCHYQHISQPVVHTEKNKQLQDIFQRMGPGTSPIAEIISGDNATHYRNRVTFRRDQNGKQGYVAIDNHATIDIDNCLIAAPEINQAWQEIKPIIQNINAKVMPFVTIRLIGNQVAIIFSVLKTFNKKELERRFEQSTYFFYTTTIKENDSQALGKDLMPLFFEPIFLQQPINDVDYIVRPDLFFQTNHEVAGKLVSYVTAQVQTSEKSVLDIYCGSGLLSIALAKQGFQVYGIEVQYPAIKCAKQSSIVAGTENLTTFQTGKADAIMQKLHENKRTFATIIVDPPRAGLHKNVIELLPKLGANQIIYISCNPSTLARDAKDLIALGYALKKTTPFEMFPMTYHMETVCTFENENIS